MVFLEYYLLWRYKNKSCARPCFFGTYILRVRQMYFTLEINSASDHYISYLFLLVSNYR